MATAPLPSSEGRSPTDVPPWGTPPSPFVAEGSMLGPIGGVVRRVRDAVAVYRAAVVVALVGQVLAVAVAVLDPAAIRDASATSLSGLSTGAGSPAISGVAAILEIAATAVGFLSLLVYLVAYVRWRGAVIEIRRASSDGPIAPGPAREAVEGYRWTLWTFAVWIVAIVVGVVAIVAVVLPPDASQAANNSSAGAPSTAQLNQAIGAATPFTLGLDVVLLVLGLFLAYFAVQSLEGFLRMGPARPPAIDLPGTRWLVFASVALGSVPFVSEELAGLGQLLGILGLGIMLAALQRYLAALDERLTVPPAA